MTLASAFKYKLVSLEEMAASGLDFNLQIQQHTPLMQDSNCRLLSFVKVRVAVPWLEYAYIAHFIEK